MTTTQAPKPVAATADYLDQRTGISHAVKGFARKVFPDHWSFLLGEVALYSFVVLLISGVFLTMFFVPSMGLVEYHGPLSSMSGQLMSEAFASTLKLSFEVRGGLLMRQIHHWAALLFMASIVTHMMRVFFTGAFRKPRELNWMVGFVLMILGLLAGFTGYSLPDDVLSGNGLRITDGVVKSIPVIGSYLSYFIFGGEFPGEDIIPRLFTLHILVVPALILALIGLHLLFVVLHKHTQYPGGGRTNNNVVGFPLFPVYVAKAGGFFFIVFGVIALMGATMAINNVWNYGPYDPSPVGAGAQPDWYMLFLEGSLRLMPGQPEFVIAGWTLSLNVLIPAVVIPGLLFTFLAVYPFVEAAVTKDKREHHVLDRPRNVPVRTGLGVAFLTAFIILALAGSNDLIATHFHLSINSITWVFRFAFFLAPVAAFWITKRICLGLQRKDRELVLHGHETGRIVRFANGEYIEVHKPLDEQERWLRVGYEANRPLEIAPREDARGVRRKGYAFDRQLQKLSGFFFEDRVEPVTPAELAAAHSHGEHDQLDSSDSAAQLDPVRDATGHGVVTDEHKH
ncbi:MULTISPECIES: cytochrome bc1 complex cytochrome b subunit [Sanguibacter]|jgi:ubiquinol-cytochrome c reductase cytochrome b subunit|uniref:Cytochrome bc1 complex cytochrome b subunit n=1 Tax=Sanguibacter inulinus TaxID=60922 RepID=A0A853ERH4_9MICO|nr:MULTISPECIES: cytochrome bc complex cytochrome b subunit [Sanguibacter]KQT98003.1 ubiquinol-cytochrome c reductase cytochrome b subunit [Sanguibacter sp. Leaf3]MBF0721872.1 cytochrome bc complex cytochrome b subunit [Sanguibacter inulinus]NYS93017.1 cytochrome bc complex cytochrome b subunit [Sanguibacter inulinus]